MPLWKQALMIAAIAALACVMAAAFLPAAHPLLARIGVLAPLDRLGLVAPPPEADADPARGTRPGTGGPGAGGPVTVIAAEAAPQVMRDVVTAIGTARGIRSVILVPEVSGRVLVLNVASGDYVKAGTVIAELDSEAAGIAVDRAALLVSDAQTTRDRLTRLKTTGTTTDLQVQEAELAVKTSELALREARFDLVKHRIIAPIAGWVGILGVEVGNQVSPIVEITRIEDRSSLLVDFRVPERVVSRLALGDMISAQPLADPGSVLPGTISALDNRVDEKSRSLLVQAAIGNADDRLRAGMAFLISLGFTGESHPAVDPLSIQWGAEGAFVWAVRDGRATRLPIRILQRNSDVVLVDATLLPGDLVVTEGVQSLRPGSEVQVAPTAPDTTAPKT